MSWPHQNELNSSGEWGRGARNKLRTHTHTHTHIHTHIARPFSSRPTSAQLCHTIHLLISVISPPTAAKLNEQQDDRKHFPCRQRTQRESHTNIRTDLQPAKAMAHISRLPQSQSLSWEREREREEKSDTYLTGGNLLAAFECIGRLDRHKSPRTVS